MEVKINKEIRNYTESMFFGLSLRQFIFFLSLPAAWRWVCISFSVHGLVRKWKELLSVATFTMRSLIPLSAQNKAAQDLYLSFPMI